MLLHWCTQPSSLYNLREVIVIIIIVATHGPNNYCQKIRYYVSLYFIYVIDKHINSKAPSTPKSIILLLGVLEPSPLRGMPCKTGHLKFSLSDPFMIGSLFCSFHGTCGSKIGWSSDKLVLWSHKHLNKYLPLCWSASLLSHAADMPVLLSCS